MSSTFIATPLGSLPKQENFKIAGTFNTGFLEFDQNIVFLNLRKEFSFTIVKIFYSFNYFKLLSCT